MKKLFFLTTLLTLFIAAQCDAFAAGMIKVKGLYYSGYERDAVVIKCECLADASDGSFPSTEIKEEAVGSYVKEGYLLHEVYLDHGSTTPDASYDVALNNSFSYDYLGGAGTGINGTAGDLRIVPQVSAGNTDGHEPLIFSTLTLTISNNSTNSAEVDIYVILKR